MGVHQQSGGIEKSETEKQRRQYRQWCSGGNQRQDDQCQQYADRAGNDDPLAGVGEATNALTFFTDELGPVTIVGPGAGRRETGFSLLIDLLNINRKLSG